MNQALVPEVDRPYRVVLRGVSAPQNMLSGHLTIEEARTRANKANSDAAMLGLQPDYEVTRKPEDTDD